MVGNEVTWQNRLLRGLLLYPGQVLSDPDVRLSEASLPRLGIFNDPQTGTHPTVEVLDRDGDQSFKDILVTVLEQRTGSLLFSEGVTYDADWTGSLVLHVRDLDITLVSSGFD